jgi:hypothetical protein
MNGRYIRVHSSDINQVMYECNMRGINSLVLLIEVPLRSHTNNQENRDRK